MKGKSILSPTAEVRVTNMVKVKKSRYRPGVAQRIPGS
jgi:hypothetical protein